MASNAGAGVTAPQQDRSRASFARVRAAVVLLLQQRGSGQFSLAEVSTTAGVSIGSIYGRVSSKAQLIHAVQAEEFDRLDTETQQVLARAGDGNNGFAESVTEVVKAFSSLLRVEAPLLAPFFLMSVEDELIRRRGAESGLVAERTFIEALLRVGAAHAVAVDHNSARWAFEVVYSVCARNLNFGTNSSTAPGQPLEWDTLTEQLARTVNLCLVSA